MARREPQVLATVVLCLLAASANGSEPFPVYPELAGLKKVAIEVTYGIDIDRKSLESAIRDRLEKAGIRVEEGADLPTLLIDVETSPLETPLCSGMMSLQVRLALRERVVLDRSRKLKAVLAQTWTDENAPAIVSKVDAGNLGAQAVLWLIDTFTYNVSYSTKEYAKWTKH